MKHEQLSSSFPEQNAESFSSSANVEHVQKNTQSKVEGWWRSHDEGIKEISKLEQEALNRGEDVEVLKGNFVNLDDNIDNEFDLEWKSQGKYYKLFIRDKGQGVFHIFNAAHPHRYITIYTPQKKIEDASGHVLQGTLEQNLSSILGIADDVRVQISTHEPRPGYYIYRIQVIPQNENVSVRRSRDGAVSKSSEIIQLQNDLKRGRKVNVSPSIEIPVVFEPEENIYVETGNNRLKLQKKQLQNGKEIYLLQDEKKTGFICLYWTPIR